ncbi:hypothetical protein GJ496_008588 [Pomphorhynchus laevis]|nr:hypothetical protein GJ496_008588 [Pomphorhynchus laevis]
MFSLDVFKSMNEIDNPAMRYQKYKIVSMIIGAKKEEILSGKRDFLHSILDDSLRNALNHACNEVASSWLNCQPLKISNLFLTSIEFKNALESRYGWTPENAPCMCLCGSKCIVL